MLKHRTAGEKFLLEQPALIEGLKWGKPRPGHDEGEVYKHVEFIWDNIDRLSCEAFVIDTLPGGSGPTNMAVAERGGELWQRLRLIALVHDSFKYQVDLTQSKSGENHHAMRARRFAENFPGIFDAQMLEVIEVHDDAYNSWQKGNRDGKWDKAKDRAIALHARLRQSQSLELFNMFFTCDTHVNDVERPDWEWWKILCRDSGSRVHYFIAR